MFLANWNSGAYVLFSVIALLIIAGLGVLLYIKVKKEKHNYHNEVAGLVEGVLKRNEIISSINSYISKLPSDMFFSLILIDYDKMTEIQNAFGEGNGKKVLNESIKNIRSVLPNRTLIGRISDDRFLILVKEDYDKNEVLKCANKICEAASVDIKIYSDTIINPTIIDSSNNGQKKFSWCTVGNGDRIANCKLSNGLNFGNITAISNKIGNLDGTRVTSGQNDSSGTSQGRRPGIFACSGGVISYGLCIMTRMLNHGVIVSTDVAGGIVGATYVLGSVDTSNLTITYCNIDTAIHYGKVKAAKYSNYSNFTYTVLKDITNSNYMNNSSDTSYIYKDENTFIFPSQSVSLSLYSNARRGFGGIFGRLQRGNSGVMQSNNFVNILNMDSKVDMIGRVDGSSYGTYIFYRLKVTGKEDTYYSARSNDTTQALVVGYTTGSTTTSELVNALTDSDIKSITITRTRSFWGNNYTYRITSVTLDSLEYEEITTSTRRYAPYNENINGNNYNSNYATETVQRTVKKQSSDNQTISLNTTIDGNVVVSGNTRVSNLNYSSNRATVTNPSNVASLLQNNISIGSNSSSSTISQYQIEIVTDDKSDTSKTYIFSDSFPLMDSEQANYIYVASNDVLADRFKNETSLNYKPNGMYVLATTKGRDASDVLPGNLKIDDLYKLNEKDEVKYIDLSNVSSKDLIDSGLNVEEMLLDYKSMFQISYSDKSLIQQKDDNGSTLYDLVLYDKNNNSPILRGGVVGSDEYGLPTITFTVSNSAFNFVNNKTDLNYYVKSAVLSEKAVIAKYGITSNEHHDFRNYYNLRSSNVLDGIYEASISGL